MPEIIWHDARKNHPGESMARGKEVAQAHFTAEPAIIFVCLPDTGALSEPASSLWFKDCRPIWPCL